MILHVYRFDNFRVFDQVFFRHLQVSPIAAREIEIKKQDEFVLWTDKLTKHSVGECVLPKCNDFEIIQCYDCCTFCLLVHVYLKFLPWSILRRCKSLKTFPNNNLKEPLLSLKNESLCITRHVVFDWFPLLLLEF